MAESRRARRLQEAREAQQAQGSQEIPLPAPADPARQVPQAADPAVQSPYGQPMSPYATPAASYDVSAPYDVSAYAAYAADPPPAAGYPAPPEPPPVSGPAPGPFPGPVPAPLPEPDSDRAPARLPVHPPEGHTPLGAPPDDADRGRGGGRRISGSSATVHAAPELQGIQRLVHAAGLPALGCLLLVWSLTTLVGDVRWGPFSVLPVAFACLSPLIALPAILMIAMSVQRRRWATLVLPAAAVGLPWSFVVAYAIPADPPSGPTVPLRAMIVTAQDGQADAADIVAAVRSQRTDLLVVTELSSGLAHDITAAGLDRALVPRYVRVPDAGGSAAEGIAIYSRFAIDEKLVSTLPGTRWPAVVATVTVGPTQVTLVAGHASRPSAAHLDRWRRDLAAFRDVARIKGPVLVLANLDATPWNPQYRSVVSGRLHDAGDVLGQGLRPTWPTWAPVPLLATDHALVAGLGVTELNALAVKGSDHRALSVGLAVPTS